jgi:hypothetical protein
MLPNLNNYVVLLNDSFQIGPTSIGAALLGTSISNFKISLLFTEPLLHASDRLLSTPETLQLPSVFIFSLPNYDSSPLVGHDLS